MAALWEKFAGKASSFAVKAAFAPDPDAGVGSTPEESASWGNFEIWVNGRDLCAHVFAGERAECVHWYLLPLCEWFADNWDPLFHEERLPNRNAAAHAVAALKNAREAPPYSTEDVELAWDHTWYDWWARHSIEAASEGGVFPSVCLRRWRDQVEISWEGKDTAGCPAGVQFIENPGYQRFAWQSVAPPLHAVLVAAAANLRERCASSERIQTLCSKLDALRSRRPDRLAWLLGLGADLSGMNDSLAALRQTVADFSDRVKAALFGGGGLTQLVVEPFPAALMFGATSPALSSSDRICLLRCLAHSYGGQSQCLDDLVADEPVKEEDGWVQGYDLAQRAMGPLGVKGDTTDSVDIEGILRKRKVTIQEMSLEDRSIRAVAIGGNGFRPTILLNQSHQTFRFRSGKRFSLAHELCHLIYDRAFARQVILPSGAWAPCDVEARANAFAAMFLMPRERVGRLVARSTNVPASHELVMEVASHLRTSFKATVHHMCNLGFLSAEERDALLEEACNPPEDHPS